MVKQLKQSGTVYSYNKDQFKRTEIKANAGDKIEWKKDGHRGHYNAVIVGFSDEKPDYVFIENWLYDWSSPSPSKGQGMDKKEKCTKDYILKKTNMNNTDKPLIVVLYDSGDPEVGFMPKSWEIQTPFTTSEMFTSEVKEFIERLLELYVDYCNGKLHAYYQGIDPYKFRQGDKTT